MRRLRLVLPNEVGRMVLVDRPTDRGCLVYTRFQGDAQSGLVGAFRPANRKQKSTLLYRFNVVRNTAIERQQVASRDLNSLLG